MQRLSLRWLSVFALILFAGCDRTPDYKVTVVDVKGQPVPGVRVHYNAPEWAGIAIQTDNRGVAIVDKKIPSPTYILFSKSGFKETKVSAPTFPLVVRMEQR